MFFPALYFPSFSSIFRGGENSCLPPAWDKLLPRQEAEAGREGLDSGADKNILPTEEQYPAYRPLAKIRSGTRHENHDFR